MDIEIREATEADIPLLHLVFELSVTGLCSRDYKPEQIHAWVARADMNRWRELVESDLQFWVALESKSGFPAGFTSINKEGYLHSMFIHPDFKRQGIATMLLSQAEAFACHSDIPSIYAEVSLTARPFFEKQGYKVEREQTIIVNGVGMRNFVMRKLVGCGNSL